MNKRNILVAAAALAAVGAGTVGVAAASTSGDAPAAGQVMIIDGRTDPADATAALKLYQNASNRSFTPTNAPTYARTDFSPAKFPDGTTVPSVSGNKQKELDGVMKVTIAHTEDSSVSVGGSAEVSLGFDLPGIVDTELSAKFTANHTWSSSYTDTESIQVTAIPGKTDWIEVADNTLTYTGDFRFDAAGVHYEVDNVSITQPGTKDGGAMDSAIYRVREMDSKTVNLPADTSGGQIAINDLPRLQQIITNEQH